MAFEVEVLGHLPSIVITKCTTYAKIKCSLFARMRQPVGDGSYSRTVSKLWLLVPRRVVAQTRLPGLKKAD